jgi:class 3 adenylate cyclase
MTEPIRVLVADDHAVVRQGLRLFLDLQPDLTVVGEAATGEEAVERACQLRPDLVLMDLAMPGTDGVQATRTIRTAVPEARVLVLTSFADDEHVLAALNAGAAGYLMKDAPPEEVADACRTVFSGEPFVHPEALRSLLHGLAAGTAPPEGTVTVLFTDIERSTELFQRLGDERARSVLREHDSILRTAIEHHGGTEVKRQGDGMMVAFSSARRALRCAVDIQHALAERNAAHPDAAVRVRMGINTGEAIAEDDDYFGAAVVVAARIAAAAQGDQILLSEITKSLVGGNRIPFEDLGEHRLKGLDGSYRLYAAQWTESPS